MAIPVKLSVAKPCPADWSNMKPTTCGRFCGLCEKQVVDFTKMDDKQLALFFSKNEANVCGRFRNDQLIQQKNLLSRGLSWLRYMLYIMIPVALFSCEIPVMGKVMGEPALEDSATRSQQADTLGGNHDASLLHGEKDRKNRKDSL